MRVVFVHLGQQLWQQRDEMCGEPSPVLFLDFLSLQTQVLMQHKNPNQ